MINKYYLYKILAITVLFLVLFFYEFIFIKRTNKSFSYNQEDFIILNSNNPYFNDNEITDVSFERYSDLDNLGRAGVVYASIGKDLMPTKEREDISDIKPTGYHSIKYDIVDKEYLYNRCHLIAYQLTGENANEKNLITCTRQMNTGVMLDYENKVANYIRKTNNHVMYRVTPVYEDNNLVASGVQIEALSVEDNGKGIRFNVFIYNVQKGIEIDYKTGNSKKIDNV